MTTKQKLEQLLLLAADSEPDDYVGGKVSATIEGKKVEVQRTGYGRKVYGKRAPEFDAWVDGEKAFIWKHGKTQVLNQLYPMVSEEHKAKAKAQAEEFARLRKEREKKDEAERKAKHEREAPARALVTGLMVKAYGQMLRRKLHEQFTAAELKHFMKAGIEEIGE